ncbi:bifunctional UDP-sugar hydrolase/5'-nucleotidase [Paenisporosarcina sp. TG20]|uniref:bifunctional metallophosphatase/5'-nucleotidase n=1 Tax=Paenisporosarcina sp. TG20 TaxID=1211706 RepID=UPI0002D6DF4A|nr:bifunctional UDP-sugar hydrolase/5'-nucleotidase [Paenisporosarcina sp. TG20]
MELDQVTLTLLLTSDVHGHVLPINYATNEVVPLGMAYAATHIKRLRKENPNLLLIDNGDSIQGTPLTYHYAKFRNHLPNPMISIMNHLEYDCTTIGNHEFNYGLSMAKKAVKESLFPWLSSNILDKTSQEPYFGFPFIVKKMNDVKVVILGVTTHYIPNWENPLHIEELDFEDAFLSTKRWVEFIRDTEKPDLLVVSYHGGFECDLENGKPTEHLTGENQGYQMCQEIEGIDLLLTGHQHRQIATTINGTYVLQSGFHAQNIGKATITLMRDSHNNWCIKTIIGEVTSLANEEPDEEVLKLVCKNELETQLWLDEAIGKIEGSMLIVDSFDVRLNEHPMIEWINRVQMDAAGVKISNTSLFDNSSRGLPSFVTMRDIVSNYIYPNTLSVLELTKEEIKEALELSASYFRINEDNNIVVNPTFITPKPQHYNYDMWEGIDYTIDVAQPIGQRIIKLSFHQQDQNGPFLVVMNNYRAGGGGNFELFKNKTVVKEILTDMAELLADYLQVHQVVKACVNNNFTVINSNKDSL